jgi:hypothetical protein
MFDPAEQVGATTAAAGIHQLLPQVADAAAGFAAAAAGGVGDDGEQVGGAGGGGVSPGALITPLPPPSQRSQLADYSPASAQLPVKPSPPIDLTSQAIDQGLTVEAVRAWLEERPEGATAAALLQHFVGGGCEQQKEGGEGSTLTTTTNVSSSSSKVAELLRQVLQQLVDDLEVMRVGRAAAASALVDLGDGATLYTLV